jgi:hypothetical protein
MRHLIALALALSFPLSSWADCTVTVASPTGGINRPCTVEEEVEKLERENAPIPAPPLLDRLKAMFSALPTSTQATLGPLAAAVFMFLTQNNPEAAKLVIQQATIPAELEPLRQQMLGAF